MDRTKSLVVLDGSRTKVSPGLPVSSGRVADTLFKYTQLLSKSLQFGGELRGGDEGGKLPGRGARARARGHERVNPAFPCERGQSRFRIESSSTAVKRRHVYRRGAPTFLLVNNLWEKFRDENYESNESRRVRGVGGDRLQVQRILTEVYGARRVGQSEKKHKVDGRYRPPGEETEAFHHSSRFARGLHPRPFLTVTPTVPFPPRQPETKRKKKRNYRKRNGEGAGAGRGRTSKRERYGESPALTIQPVARRG